MVESLVAWIAALFSGTEGAKLEAAAAGAIVTAILAAVGYLLRAVALAAQAVLRRRREALIVFRRFRAEVELARRLLPATATAAVEADYLERMRAQERDLKRFKGFGIALIEHEIKDEMRQILHIFSADEMTRVERYIFLSKFLDEFYKGLNSDDFAALPLARKEATVRTYYAYLRRRISAAEETQTILRRHPWAGDSAIERLARRLFAFVVGGPAQLLGALARAQREVRLRRARDRRAVRRRSGP